MEVVASPSRRSSPPELSASPLQPETPLSKFSETKLSPGAPLPGTSKESEISSVAPSAGITVKPSRSPESNVHVPSPLSVPAFRKAPSGTPETTTESSPLAASEMASGTSIVVSALVWPADSMETLNVGASATPVTSTSSVVVVVAVSPLDASVVVALTLNEKSSLLSAGGVTLRPSKSSASNVHDPSPLSVPALSAAPSGTPEIVMLKLSEPSVSERPASISSAIAVSSLPTASAADNSASSALVSVASTEIVAVVVDESPSSSVAVAETVRSKAGVPSATVIERPSRSPASSVHVPSPLSVPASSVTPLGTSEIVIDSVSDPSVSESAAETSRS